MAKINVDIVAETSLLAFVGVALGCLRFSFFVGRLRVK